MEIYAPLANRLGIWQLKWELEDLSFRYLEPERYKHIAKLLQTKRGSRERYISQVERILKEELARNGIEAEVKGRAKHIYSIAQKAEKYAEQQKGFEQIYDLLALRVIVNTIGDCYNALGVVHGLWHPIPGQFDDYIASPKESLYQSLHTTVMALGARPLMHQLAEYGVAAHWRYKEGAPSSKDQQAFQRMSWLRQLIEWQRDMAQAEEFVESVKTDLFRDQVFVYTPKGEIKEMPAGASTISSRMAMLSRSWRRRRRGGQPATGSTPTWATSRRATRERRSASGSRSKSARRTSSAAARSSTRSSAASTSRWQSTARRSCVSSSTTRSTTSSPLSAMAA
jgi:GTP pyrophosphokinase